MNVVLFSVLTSRHFATDFGGLCWPNDRMQLFVFFFYHRHSNILDVLFVPLSSSEGHMDGFV